MKAAQFLLLTRSLRYFNLQKIPDSCYLLKLILLVICVTDGTVKPS
jgi:hypothetical protein